MNTLKWILPVLVLIGFNGCMGGCAATGANAQEQYNADLAKLQVLQQGKANGHLVLQSGGKVGVGAENNFYLGLMDSNLSFTGQIDFSEAQFPQPPGAQPFPATTTKPQ